MYTHTYSTCICTLPHTVGPLITVTPQQRPPPYNSHLHIHVTAKMPFTNSGHYRGVPLYINMYMCTVREARTKWRAAGWVSSQLQYTIMVTFLSIHKTGIHMRPQTLVLIFAFSEYRCMGSLKDMHTYTCVHSCTVFLLLYIHVHIHILIVYFTSTHVQRTRVTNKQHSTFRKQGPSKLVQHQEHSDLHTHVHVHVYKALTELYVGQTVYTTSDILIMKLGRTRPTLQGKWERR